MIRNDGRRRERGDRAAGAAALPGILFVIRSLGAGGAERQLILLARELAHRGADVAVAVFYPGGSLETELAPYGIPVMSLEKRGRWDLWAPLRRLHRLVRQRRPAIVHSYLPDANLLAALMRPWLGATRLVWGVRASQMSWRDYDRAAFASFTATRLLSRAPHLIIANSQAGARHHAAQGYPASRIVTVPNGFDTSWLRPDRALGTGLRDEWGIPDRCVVVGIVARLDPMKQHETMLRAAAEVHRHRTDVRFVVVGDGTGPYARSLRSLADALGVSVIVRWAGHRSDMPAVYNALDVAMLTSAAEGFPNVIGEAMACGVPCIATAAGDSAVLVGDTGTVVPVGDAQALATALLELLDAGPDALRHLGERARARIEAHFSSAALADATLDALMPILPPDAFRP